MSDFDRNYAAASRGVSADRAVVDAGLRAYMVRVYNYMATAVGFTGVVAWLTFQAAGGDAVRIVGGRIVGATAFGQLIYSFPAVIVLFLATLGLVWWIGSRIDRVSAGTAWMLFMVYAGLFGILMSSVFVQFTMVSITRTFFISAAAFGALSFYGYTTQRDLTPVRSFLIMGLFGLVLAILVEFVLAAFGIRSSMLHFIISAVGVLIFAGLTAADTQRIKEMYDAVDNSDIIGRKAVMGALSLYLDFINLFTFLLQFVGDRR